MIREIGSKVRIRSWESMVEEFGVEECNCCNPPEELIPLPEGDYYVGAMKPWCEEEHTIIEAGQTGRFPVYLIDNGTDEFWFYESTFEQDPAKAA